MKELKAVGILETFKKEINIQVNCGYTKYAGTRKEIDKALSELQELTQEKSCNGCKHWRVFDKCCDPYIECSRKYNDQYTPKG